MNELIARIQAMLANLSPRERLLVAGAGAKGPSHYDELCSDLTLSQRHF